MLINTESVKIDWRRNLKLTLRARDGKKQAIKIPVSQLLIDSGSSKMFRKIFQSSSKLQTNLIRTKSLTSYYTRSSYKNGLPSIGVNIDRTQQKTDEILLTVFTPDMQEIPIKYALYNILSEFNLFCGSYPEVRYIGQTKDLKQRIYNHGKVQQAVSEERDEKDIYIYLFQFSEQKLIHNQLPNLSILMRDDVAEITKPSKIDLVEMCLINYFKPRPLNSDFVNANIPSNKKVQKHLVKNNYTDIVLEIDHENLFWKFGSQHIKHALRHEVLYQL